MGVGAAPTCWATAWLMIENGEPVSKQQRGRSQFAPPTSA
jgi:hypothetical protein